MENKAALLLLPNLLGESRYHQLFLPASVDKAVLSLDGLIAESDSGGRRFLSHFELSRPINQIPVAVFNKNTPEKDIDFFLEPMQQGQRWGYVSDAGLPCIADPGSKLVARARQLGIPIQAFIGPSSIFLALMLSGLPGQQFVFHGYIDKDPAERKKQISQWEKNSMRDNYTQIFMETPYRNAHTLQSLLETLSDKTYLCVAWDLTLPTQGIVSQTVALWKKSPLPNLEKKAALFLFN